MSRQGENSMIPSLRRALGRDTGKTAVPAISDDAMGLHPALRAAVALCLGVGLGAVAALFIPRRRGE